MSVPVTRHFLGILGERCKRCPLRLGFALVFWGKIEHTGELGKVVELHIGSEGCLDLLFVYLEREKDIIQTFIFNLDERIDEVLGADVGEVEFSGDRKGPPQECANTLGGG